MSEVTGYVEAANSRESGGKRYFSFLVDGTWYGCGVRNPKVSKGDKVKFEASQNGKYWNVDMNTFKSKEGEAPQVSQNKSAGSYKKSGGGGGGQTTENWEARQKYWDNKEQLDVERQQIISLQAATNTAIEMVNSGIEQGFLTVAGSKKNEKWESYKEYVLGVANDLFAVYLAAPTTAKTVDVESPGNETASLEAPDDSTPDAPEADVPEEDEDW